MKKIVSLLLILFLGFSAFAGKSEWSFGLFPGMEYSAVDEDNHTDFFHANIEVAGEYDYVLDNGLTLVVCSGLLLGEDLVFSLNDSSHPMAGIKMELAAGKTWKKEFFAFKLFGMPLGFQGNIVFDDPDFFFCDLLKSGAKVQVFFGKGNIKYGMELGVNYIPAGFWRDTFFINKGGYETYAGLKILFM